MKKIFWVLFIFGFLSPLLAQTAPKYQSTIAVGADPTGSVCTGATPVNTFLGSVYTCHNSVLVGGTPLNETSFVGGDLVTRLSAACTSLNGTGGTVEIPPYETSTSPGFFVPPLGCIVEDHRNIIYPTQNGYTLFNPPSAGDLYNSIWNDPSPSNTVFRHYQALQVTGQAIGGGMNTYDGAGGVKSTYSTLNMNIFASTPGQKIMNSWVMSNFSPGDDIFIGAQIYDTGWASAAGDESVKASSIYLTTGATPLTGTIASINGSTMTVICTPTSNVSCGQMGEQQAIVNTSRGVQNTGTATITRNNPPIVTISGGSVTCPGGTNPCSNNTSGGVGLYFEFTAETHSGIHVVMPIIAVDSTGTQLTLLIQFRQTAGGVPTNSNWQGYTTTGAYAVYRGSMITAVPYQAALYTSPQATVASMSPFQVGDTIMVPGGNNRNVTGHTLLAIPGVPCPAIGACINYDADSGGYYPMTYGFSANGNYQYAPFRATWVGFPTTPIWGVNLYGAPPSNGYFEGADFTNLTSTENMLCGGTHTSGANTCISLYRTAGATQDFWQIPNTEFTSNIQIDGQVLTGLNVVGGLSTTNFVSSSSGGFGSVGNLATCSWFDASCYSTAWFAPFSGFLPATITPNAATDLYGGTTVEESVTDSSASPLHVEGQQQNTASVSPPGNYVFSIYARTDGTAPASHIILSLLSNGLCHPAQFSTQFAITTTLTRYSVYCALSTTTALAPTWLSDEPNVDIYTWCAQVEVGTVPGPCVHTTATAVNPALIEVFQGNIWHKGPNDATFNTVGSGTTSNTDLTGRVPLSGGTGSYSFSETHTNAPNCVCTDSTAVNAVQCSTSTSALTITGTGTDTITYVCMKRE